MFRSSRFKILFPPFVILGLIILFLNPFSKCPKPNNLSSQNEESHMDLYLHPLVDIHPLPKNVPSEILTEVSKEVLASNLAPNNVFYVWCGKRWFEFKHYLSILSAIKNLNPDNVYFYYDQYPVVDRWLYNNWIDYIKKEFPFFKLIHANSACAGHKKYNIPWITNRLSELGGLFVAENTIITYFPLSLRKYHFIDAINFHNRTGFLLAKYSLPGRRNFRELLKDKGLNTKVAKCYPEEDMQNVSRYKKRVICINTRTTLFPQDIWETKTRFAMEVRNILYGSPKLSQPIQDDSELIPNIAHIVWLGGGKMDFLFYLGVLSLVYVAKVDMVFIHGDLPPSGSYWYKIKNNPKVRHVYRENPKEVYGNDVNIISHMTDVWRVDFMLKYGGIYVDTDTAFVRPLTRELRSYDAVATYDWTYWNDPWPNTINFGVTAGKRGAKYWKLFQKSMAWFIDKDWSFNGLRLPYRLKELHPNLLKIDPKLQITCFEYKCHPTYWENYHNESIHHLNSNSIKNWKEDAFAFHWTLPTPPELLNEENLKKSDTIFAEIGRYILSESGINL